MNGYKAKIRGTTKDGRLRGRFLWLLETMCRKCGVDIQMIDSTLDYYENKANIEAQVHKRLYLNPKKERNNHEKGLRAMVKVYDAVS